MLKRMLLPVCLLAGVTPLAAQTPLCDIKDTRVSADVSYDTARRVYTYAYSISSGLDNTGAIREFRVDVSAESPQNPSDPDLTNDGARIDARSYANFRTTPADAVAVGLTSSSPSWLSGVGPITTGLQVTGTAATPQRKGGVALWTSVEDDIFPGQTKTGFKIESKAPPAIRSYRLEPLPSRCVSTLPPPPNDVEEGTPEGFDLASWTVTGSTIGPMLESEGTKYNGGGQKPSDVNLFLSYRAPFEARNHLAAGTTDYTVIVYYGATTDPGTFTATLNGAPANGLFHPTPGAAEVVKIQLASGTNKLQLAIDGITQSGRVATDTDTLTFLVP
jgi:hypothetical protein